MGRRTRETKKKTEVVASMGLLVPTKGTNRDGTPKKRAIAYVNLTDLISDDGLDKLENQPDTLKDLISKVEIVWIDDQAEDEPTKFDF